MTRIQKILAFNTFTVFVGIMTLLVAHGLVKSQRFYASLNDGSYDHNQIVLTGDMFIQIHEEAWIKARLVREDGAIVGLEHIKVVYTN